ncbi:MAG: hypothetical protein ABIG55_04985 [Candidatus Omnitrophota bacterium]
MMRRDEISISLEGKKLTKAREDPASIKTRVSLISTFLMILNI